MNRCVIKSLMLSAVFFCAVCGPAVVADEDEEVLPRNISSRMGFCEDTGNNYYNTHNRFVNLMYSRQMGGIAGPEGRSPDGWPLGEIERGSSDYRCSFMFHGSEEVVAPGQYHEADRPGRNFMWRSLLQEDVPLDSTQRHEFTFRIYWEGDGEVEIRDGGHRDTHSAVEEIEFKGPNFGTEEEPDHRGPFDDGPRKMNSRTWTGDRSVNDSALVHVYVTRSNADDPVRNIMVLMPGFNESDYEPMMVNPKWIEKSEIYRVQRFFTYSFGRSARERAYDTGRPFEQRHEGVAREQHETILEPRWEHPVTEGRIQGGYGAWSRPTHASFGGSPRAAIELCNAIDADIWWSHPYVAVRDDESQPEFDADGNRIRDLWVDMQYVQGYAALINEHLDPGRKVYSEWSNESWNGWGIDSYGSAKLWAQQCFFRTRYNPPGYGTGPGDGRVSSVFDVLASAMLARHIRAHLDDDRELIATCNFQDAYGRPGNEALAIAYATAAGRELLEELDAIGTAPYRNWPGSWREITGLTQEQMEEGPRVQQASWQQNEAHWARVLPWPLDEFPRWQPGTAPGPGSGYMTTQDMADYWNSLGAQLPWDDPESWWNDQPQDPPEGVSRTQNTTRWRATRWKLMAIDALPARCERDDWSFHRMSFENGRWARLGEDAPPRWNLKLVAYESGQHNTLGGNARYYQYAGRRFRDLQYHPDYRIWHERYYEALFSPGPRRN